MEDQRRRHPGAGRRPIQPGDDGSGRHGVHPLQTQVRALPAQRRLHRLRQPQLGQLSRQEAETDPAGKTAYFLLLQHGERVWLEQRPAVGLWGGLFCFPQFSERDGLELWLQQRGLKGNRLEQLTAFRHTFSHFHLDIVPMWLEINAAGGGMDEGPGLWYNLAQPPSVGLAAPVDRLLQQLAKQSPIQQNLYGDNAIDEELA